MGSGASQPLNKSKQTNYGTTDSKGSMAIDRDALLKRAADMDEGQIHSLSKPEYMLLIGDSYDPNLRKKDAYDAIHEAMGLKIETAWLHTYDHTLLWCMVIALTILSVVTYMGHPGLFFNFKVYWPFWLEQVIKTTFMLTVAYIGGYIVEKHNVKVNYTRKVQHFCAYLIPLVMRLFVSAKSFQKTLAEAIIVEWWGYWWTMLSFFVFIYPIRTRISFIDRCYSSLDRPEDRPNTIYWITSQIFLGYIIMSVYTTFMTWSGQLVARALIFIPVIITGIGDGIAEPVGRSVGGKIFSQGLKYQTAGLGSDKLYTRSFEGSFAVWITGVIAILGMYDMFFSWYHVVVALILVPGASTIAEAYSPHTWDTPFLLSTGAGILWAQTFIPAKLSMLSILLVLAVHVVIMGIISYIGWTKLVLERNGIRLDAKKDDTLVIP
mmetsp:Transcript_2870/g.4167  ORF Transcript_2870/g.4167 Transcript_2870/m.4167 type:complete len:435 (+) Transcript_2870:165-1469(+)|eukprot:CAMPEP_0184481600 /NCGR_PEP_ID=MMETSP0113_2-20130426/3151_1 /TAXON_ID=91329 /ORGANISM="Norrisiella sphaerica, Strain BC52" /LENGTH=434 /DNA_ID=CAMNT_0026860819 /DNA_START=165 /DNA_END=1469 /DNA_ORIENTATION=-